MDTLCLKRKAAAAAVFGIISVLASTVYAQTKTPGMERLNAQMQAAAAPAAAQAAAPATPNPNCTLLVPDAPFSPQGLATPYELTATDPAMGPCNESNPAQAAFVQAAILDPATGQISVYNPLVIDKGDHPLAAPVVPKLPDGAIVATWFGFNGTNLTLQSKSGDALRDGRCVNGLNGSIFSQYSYCNAPAFVSAANQAIANGQLQVPPLGTASDGKPCPTVRDFFIADQDQSDNLTTLYLVSPHGHIAQLTKANQAAHPTSVPLGNASDNRLTDAFVLPAMGCTPWTAPDLADPGSNVTAVVLNELLARNQQATPVALVPVGDPMAQINGNESLTKTNLYRKGVDQPTADSFFDVDTGRYCRQLLRTFPNRLLANQAALSAFASPDAAAANNLFNFLGQRFVASYQLLNCATLINQANPVSVTMDNNMVTTSTTVNQAALQQILQKIAPQQAEDNAKDSAARSRQSSF
ncbi:MAG: hypothetical protein JO042_00775 [Sinobacteraceae bacterium]|nr:hypothetical protein [Nevskiaceae bacterium]